MTAAVADGVHPTFCRVCQAACGIEVRVESGRAVAVTGDRRNPHSRGYTCAKGRSLPEQLRHPRRLLGALRRDPDGRLRPVPTATAVEHVAASLRGIVERHGPRAVAVYLATGSAGYPAATAFATAFCAAVGTPMLFSPSTIDQPGKQVAAAVHGRWGAHARPLDDADAWLLVGANPVVSMWGGTLVADPVRRLRALRDRGGRLVVVDPRRTETAALADVHLRPRPGTDPALLAGLVRGILALGAHDAPFCEAHVEGLDRLAAAVEAFDPPAVTRITGVPEPSLAAAVAALASTRRGGVSVGTGPNMARRGTLTEYLALCLHTVCGYWPRGGEPVANPGVLAPPRPWRAQALAPDPIPDDRMRVRGLRRTAAGMPTAALAEEILEPGDGQVRALLCLGGNPVSAWPDEARTRRAMAALELLVCVDVRPTATTELADVVFGARMHLEVPQYTSNEQSLRAYGATSSAYGQPYAMYAPRLVEAPPGSDLIEEWELLRDLATQLGLRLRVAGREVGAATPADTDDVYRWLTDGSRVPLDEVKAHPHGAVFDAGAPVHVEPAETPVPHRLDVGAVGILDGLRARTAAPAEPGDLLLTVRRRAEVKNSSGHDLTTARRGRPNELGVHPVDLSRLGVADGQTVTLRAAGRSADAVVAADDTLLPGTASLTHGFGTGGVAGTNPNRLVASDVGADPVTGMPWSSALPVTIVAKEEIP